MRSSRNASCRTQQISLGRNSDQTKRRSHSRAELLFRTFHPATASFAVHPSRKGLGPHCLWKVVLTARGLSSCSQRQSALPLTLVAGQANSSKYGSHSSTRNELPNAPSLNASFWLCRVPPPPDLQDARASVAACCSAERRRPSNNAREKVRRRCSLQGMETPLFRLPGACLVSTCLITTPVDRSCPCPPAIPSNTIRAARRNSRISLKILERLCSSLHQPLSRVDPTHSPAFTGAAAPPRPPPKADPCSPLGFPFINPNSCSASA